MSFGNFLFFFGGNRGLFYCCWRFITHQLIAARMRTIAMCFSLAQFPRCKLHSLANSCRVYGSSFKMLCSNFDLEGGYIRRTINTKSGGSNERLIATKISPEKTPDSGSCKLGAGNRTQRSRKISIASNVISQNKGPNLATYEVETIETESDQYDSNLAKLATIICFDIETTGFSRERDRIIEFACQDLRGGDYSTFQTLVNPERDVPNQHIHGISAHMVNRQDVPRMKDLIPVLVEYIESRRIPGGPVILVSHNGRTFDVPFLKKEFCRCSYEIPPDWSFVDSCQMARALIKSLGSQVSLKISLQALREHYSIPLIGPAHRALSDVHSLALVFQRLTFDLKMPVSRLIQLTFK